MGEDLSDEQLERVYGWVDGLPLSRPKKNIARDFSDGVLVAEIVKFYFPNWIELHNYPTANNAAGKSNNWFFLNKKIFSKKLGFEIDQKIITNIVKIQPGTIEKFLVTLKAKLEQKKDEITSASIVTESSQKSSQKSSQRRKGGRRFENDMPEVDQYMVKGTRGHRGQQKIDVKPPDFEHITHKNLQRSEAHPELLLGMDPRIRKDPKLSLLYEEKVQECLSKDETIQILNAKIRRLEHLVELKDLRLNELQINVESLRPTGGHHI